MYDPLELLHLALEHPLGIAVPCSDPKLLKTRLYKARADALDPRLACITISVSRTNPDGELWIVRKPDEAPEAHTEPS